MDKENIIDVILKRFFSIILPLFTMVILCWIFTKICVVFDVGEYIFDESYNLPLTKLCFEFFRSGSVVSLLGAAWFIVVLFFTIIFAQLLWHVFDRNIVIFTIISMLIYLYGFYRMKSGVPGLPYGMDQAFISQGYYCFAFALNKVSTKINIKNNIMVSAIAFVMSSILMINMPLISGNLHLVNLGKREVDHIFWTSIAIINGIVWLISLSMLLSRVKLIKKVMLILGKNTLGIMFLHFGAFKIVTFVLCLMGCAQIEELRKLTPSESVSEYWVLYVVVSTLVSLIVWIGLKKIPVLSTLLGDNKKIIDKVRTSKLYMEIKDTYVNLFATIKTGIMEFKQKELCKINVLNIILISICVVSCIGCKYIPPLNNEKIEKMMIVEGPLYIEFPYNSKDIIFVSGWLEQSDDETYRWIEQESVFKVYLSNQTKIKLEGYIPESIEEISSIKLYLNGELIAKEKVIAGDAFIIEEEITQYISEGENEFRIEFDATRIPTEDDVDKRVFSAMINQIAIE